MIFKVQIKLYALATFIMLIPYKSNSQTIYHYKKSTNSKTTYGISGSWVFECVEYEGRQGITKWISLEYTDGKRYGDVYNKIYGGPKIYIRKEYDRKPEFYVLQNPFESFNYNKAISVCKLTIGNNIFKKTGKPWSEEDQKLIVRLFMNKSSGSIEFIDPLNKKSRLNFSLIGFNRAWQYCTDFLGYNPLND